jgi:hypothetical protein
MPRLVQSRPSGLRDQTEESPLLRGDQIAFVFVAGANQTYAFELGQ